MTRPADMPTGDRFAHGTRARYVCGCRCAPCRASNTASYHERQARAKARALELAPAPTVPISKTFRTTRGAIRVRTYARACPGVDGKPCSMGAHLRKDSKGGICRACRERLVWNGLVSARGARRHLRRLSAAGVGRRAVGAACDVGDTLLTEVIAGRKRFIRAAVARRILSVDARAIADSAIVSAGRTWAILDELLARGWTKADLARRLGMKRPALQFGTRVLARTALAVERLHRTAGDPLPRARRPSFCECIKPLSLDGQCVKCERPSRPAGMMRALLVDERPKHAIASAFEWQGGWSLERRTSRRAKVNEENELRRLVRSGGR